MMMTTEQLLEKSKQLIEKNKEAEANAASLKAELNIYKDKLIEIKEECKTQFNINSYEELTKILEEAKEEVEKIIKEVEGLEANK